MNLKLRQATLNDLEEIQHLFVTTIRDVCSKDYDSAQIEAWTCSVNNVDRWQSSLTDQYFIVAELDETIVGFGSLENGNNLFFLYVHKDFQRKGIAHRLFEKLKAKSQELGFDTLTSDVSKTARPFFEAKGFKVVQENNVTVAEVSLVNYNMSE